MTDCGIHFWKHYRKGEIPRVRHLRFFSSWGKHYGVTCFTVANFYLSENSKPYFLNFGAVILNFGIEIVCYEETEEGRTNAPVREIPENI